jgi:hypothetical protein
MVVRRWTQLYTRGLEASLRDARRAEIDSDLWSQVHEANEAGHGPITLGAELLIRLVLGIPADIAWRLSHRGVTIPAAGKEVGMGEPRSHHVLTAIGVGLAVLYAAYFGMWRVQVAWFLPFAVVLIIGCLIAVVGLLLVSRRPLLGGGLAATGTMVVGAMVVGGLWIPSQANSLVLPVGIAMSLPLLVIGTVRAWQVKDAQRERPD